MNKETRFPRGLFQPENSFKFSSDALLLAAFSDNHVTEENVLDLGSGCGVVGFSLLLRHPQVVVTGIDSQPDLVEASLKNARNLFLEERFSALCCDVASLFTRDSLQQSSMYTNTLVPQSFDLVVANPPYHIYGHGRQPEEALRCSALFGEEQTLSVFCATAARALKPKGRYCLVFPASRIAEVFSCCKQYGLGMKRLLCVHAQEHKKAELILIETQKSVKDNIVIEAPLFLYDKKGLSDAARNFCPELV